MFILVHPILGELLIEELFKSFYLTGAGYHSDTLRKDYQKTCFVACKKAALALNEGGNAVDAVEKAIIGNLLQLIKLLFFLLSCF